MKSRAVCIYGEILNDADDKEVRKEKPSRMRRRGIVRIQLPQKKESQKIKRKFLLTMWLILLNGYLINHTE